MLFNIFFVLLAGLTALFISKENNSLDIKRLALGTTGLALVFSLVLLVNFNNNIFHFPIMYSFEVSSFSNLYNFEFGLDGMSLHFCFLSALLIFLCILFIWDEVNFREYAMNLILIEICLFGIFSILDILIFYVFFEAILVPMFLIIGLWGSRERKIRAVYLFFFYTLASSVLLLVGIFYIYNQVGTFSLEYIMSWNFSETEQRLLWFVFFLSFASKIPMFPFHIWLPEAHVEAPTVGSVLLAGILLKLGVYGFLRFSLTLFPEASLYFSPLVYLFSLIGVVYASLAALRQTDMKRIIAYSSIAHMNLVTLGIFSFNVFGIEGAILQSISHGFVSGGMFFLIGILYDRYHSRFLYYYGGLVHFMPIYATIFLVFTMANIALPGTSSFIGEFLLFVGIFKTNAIVAILGTLGIILSGGYSLWLYNRVIFGNLKVNYTILYKDLTEREFIIMSILFFFVIFVGVYPTFFLSDLHLASSAVSITYLF